MLAAKNRLTKKTHFESTRKKGFRVYSQLINFVIFKRDDLEESRFGFVVAKRVSKKAVIRNRQKRLLREAIKILLKEIKPGLDIILYALPEAVNAPLETVVANIRSVFIAKNLLK